MIFSRIFHILNWIFCRNYRIRRRTLAGKIPYYVSENYAAELRDFYQGSLARLEREVKLAYACKREEEESEFFFQYF